MIIRAEYVTERSWATQPLLRRGCRVDPPPLPRTLSGFNSNRNYEGPSRTGIFWGETKEKRSFADRHESTKVYIEYMRPRCVELHRVLKKTGSFYYHCDRHASHYVKVMLDQIFGKSARNFWCGCQD